jgi:hypothetical protein
LGLAIVFAWYGNRMRAIQREKERLAGVWDLVEINGATAGRAQLQFGGDDGATVYPPRHEVGTIDFFLPDGKGGKRTSRAIYRFEENDTIRFAQNDADERRPVGFDPADCDSLFIVRKAKEE